MGTPTYEIAIEHCRQLHPEAPCHNACDACWQIAVTLERYEMALRIIAGQAPHFDDSLDHSDLARIALETGS